MQAEAWTSSAAAVAAAATGLTARRVARGTAAAGSCPATPSRPTTCGRCVGCSRGWGAAQRGADRLLGAGPWLQAIFKLTIFAPAASPALLQVHGALYSFVAPTPTNTDPTTVAYSADVARLVGLDPAGAHTGGGVGGVG